MNYIDIHCHLLPEVDDGPMDMEEALELAMVLTDLGIKEIVVTPHYIERADYSLERQNKISEIFRNMKAVLNDNDVFLKLHQGGELTLNYELIDLAKKDMLVTLGEKSSYVLLEFPFYQPLPPYTEEVLFELKSQGYDPIIAHPERITAFREDPSYLYELYQKGFVFQVNAGSFLGMYGRGAMNLAGMMLEGGLIHLVATDAHNLSIKKLKEKKWSFENSCDNLFIYHPRLVLEGEKLPYKEPRPQEEVLVSRERGLLEKIKSLFFG